MGENNFLEKSPVDSAYTLRVKNFVKITLSRTSSEINAFLRFTQKLKMAAKNGGKRFLGKVASRFSDTRGGGGCVCVCVCVKNFIEISLSYTVSQINAFYTEIQDGRQKWWENDFWENIVS